MAPKARYNDKARSGGLAKAQAIRDARKHGRRLPEGEAPQTKKQKRMEKYVDAKIRNDEKVRLIKLLGQQPKVEGLTSTKIMKRTTNQAKKRNHERLSAYSETAGSDSENDASETDSEPHPMTNETEKVEQIYDIQHNVSGIETKGTEKRTATDFGFGNTISTSKRPRKSTLKYNWRAKFEEEKLKKAGLLENETSEDSDSTTESKEEIAEESESDAGHELEVEEKRNAFRSWAAQQTGSMVSDLAPLPEHTISEEVYVPRPRSKSPELVDNSDLTAPELRPVLIDRDPVIEETRSQLPAYAYEQELVEKIKTHSTVIVSGATGSGKTTQLPQFLYEAGFKGIGITQPRRVAAVSMARRVATELGSEGSKVGYQIRYESTVKTGTEIKFMTDGVLLRELSVDFLLSKYSVLIIDEAHERSINTDILIGVLSRVIRLRKETANPLRLIIMSATLRVTDFSENRRLFAVPPPIMSIEARQFPVGVHFSRRTEMSTYVDEAFKKVCKIHEKLPAGGILVFLTGQQEIQQCAKLLREKFGTRVLNGDNAALNSITQVRATDQAIELEDIDIVPDPAPDDNDVDDYEDASDSDISDIELTENDKATPQESKIQKFIQILPLYSLLPTTEQMKVFVPPPAQCRQIVLATNVAETSLTIPGIRYVVDSGRAKTKKFKSRVQSFEIDWISKASAEQRSGRAGRTGPGHVYRLYSSAVYDSSFPAYSDAEILTTPIDGIVLQMKSMNIHTVANFPFPTAPDREALMAAERLLINLGALDSQSKITELGRQMSLFPLNPRFAKMVVIGDQGGILPYVIALVAGLSAEDPFIRPEALHDEVLPEGHEDHSAQASETRNKTRQAYGRVMSLFSKLDPCSDASRLLMAVCAADYASDHKQFCHQHFLRPKAMDEIKKLRSQISNLIRTMTDISLSESLRLSPPDASQLDLMHKVLGAGFVDQICMRADLLGKGPVSKGNLLRIPYIPLAPLDRGLEFAYIHPASHSIRNSAPSDPPSYLLYSSLSASPNDPDKVRIKVLSYMPGHWLAEIAAGTPLLKYGKPLISSLAHVDILDGGKRRRVPVIPTLQLNGSGRQGWPLPPVKITQKLVGSRWVSE